MSGASESRRRDFFREAAARLISPLADYLAGPTDNDVVTSWLRPPGVISEEQLAETCIRCGVCVDVCPADAIYALGKSSGDAVGTPAIDPDRAPCVVCDGLKCTTSCPSGALLPLLSPSDIVMGVAEVYAALCVRSRGEACTVCVDRCPLGETAIRILDEGAPQVSEAGCVGCGVCQFVCPTDPKAIVVHPRRSSANAM